MWMVDWVDWVFYHNVYEICWHRPIRPLKLGHVTGQGSMSMTWVGQVSDPGKNSFHKRCKNLDDIAVYLIASLKSNWKNNKFTIWIPGYFSWIYKMIDFFKGSIVKFELNFENASGNKLESISWWQISSQILVCWEWGNLTIVNIFFFSKYLMKAFWLILFCLPRIIMDTLLPIFIKCTFGI